MAASEACLIAVARALHNVGGGGDVGPQGTSVKQVQGLYSSAIGGRWPDDASDRLVTDSLIEVPRINVEVLTHRLI